MKISKLHTLWIMVLSAVFTANTCMGAIIKRFTGTINRRWVDKALHLWVDKLLNLIQVDWRIINPNNVGPKQGQATIIMCNHASLYDIPLSFKAFPQHSIRMLAKKELARIPILGKGMVAAEFPFIDRKNKSQAIKDLANARNLMEDGIVLWVAPEGTRSKDGCLAPFKKGAFITAIEAKATIIPIGIRGAYDILPARTFRFNINQTAEVHIGKPIDASQYSLKTKKELLQEVHHSIKELLGEEEALKSGTQSI